MPDTVRDKDEKPSTSRMASKTPKAQLIPLDVFVTRDKIPPTPAQGLRVHLMNKGGPQMRTLLQWRNLYTDYMSMGVKS